jgi:hypothetical protein
MVVGSFNKIDTLSLRREEKVNAQAIASSRDSDGKERPKDG